MYHQGLPQPDWESVPRPLKDGLTTARFKESSPKEGSGDTTSTQCCQPEAATPLILDRSSYMPEFQVALRSPILQHRLSFLSLVTPIPKSLPTSAADSISSAKVFKPYWSEFSTIVAAQLSLPTKIGSVDLGSILLHGSAAASKPKYWFSTKLTSAQNAKWLRIFSPSSTSLVADCTDSENTKSKSLKTLSYRVYPSKELEAIWKKWVAAARKIYNISIAFLNQHQGYEQIGKSGGKRGFRAMLKASGLIPSWCTELGISKVLDNASMEAFIAWKETKKCPSFIGKGKAKKPHSSAGKKMARFRSIRDQKLTLQFDPTAYKNGNWMVSRTKHISPPEFRGHSCCVLTDGATELTSNKGRWFAHFAVAQNPAPIRSLEQKIVSLDPGVRTFMTGFDGGNFLEFANGDFSRIAKLCLHLDKLKSRHDLSKGGRFKRLRFRLRQAMEKVRTRIKNLRTECHKQVGSYLARNYDIIVLPTFETSQMVAKKARKLHSKTARAMMTWAFYQFSQTLEHLCNRYGSRLVRITEEYTSKTCVSCGHVHQKLGSSKKFKCPNCGFEIPRDFNGAGGIMLKALWDTTFLDQVGNVVLDVSDVAECLG
jgi:putative transposase